MTQEIVMGTQMFSHVFFVLLSYTNNLKLTIFLAERAILLYTEFIIMSNDKQVMKDVCMGGPGHYLGHNQTISLMQTEYIYPVIGDRSSPREWEELGKPNLIETAIKRKQEILDHFHPMHVSDEIDADLRRRFNLLLNG